MCFLLKTLVLVRILNFIVIIHIMYYWRILNNWNRPFLRDIYMMTSSNENIFRVTGPLCGEFTGPGEFSTQRPVMRSFDVFFDLRLNKRLSKQPWGWWFETPSWSLWRQCNDMPRLDVSTRVCWMIWYSYSFLSVFTCRFQLYSSGFSISW